MAQAPGLTGLGLPKGCGKAWAPVGGFWPLVSSSESGTGLLMFPDEGYP